MSSAAIAALVPHAGPMCLLEEIVAWDDVGIHCRSGMRLGPAHPLALSGRVSAVACIEYAAQAVAVHGGLLAREHGVMDSAAGDPGRLVAIKDCRWVRDGLAGADGPLDVRAQRQLAGPAGFIYDFTIGTGAHTLIDGRLTIKTGSGPG